LKNHYLKQALELTTNALWDEIKRICEQANLVPKHYLMFRQGCGIIWVLEKIAGDIYLSTKSIDTDIRYKLFVLYTIEKTHESFVTMFRINDKLETNNREKMYSWGTTNT
jgi:hypothetical protein